MKTDLIGVECWACLNPLMGRKPEFLKGKIRGEYFSVGGYPFFLVEIEGTLYYLCYEVIRTENPEIKNDPA